MAESSPPSEKLTNLTISETPTVSKETSEAAAANASSNKTETKSGKTPPKPEREWSTEMEVDFQRILTVGEECISPEELKKLILVKGRGSDHPVGFNLYDGFEPSGRMHIAQGVFKAMNVNKCTLEGTNSTFTFWVADWFALMNDKMGGDLEKIKTVGKYLIEVWKAAGMNLDHVVFKWASEEITNSADIYWPIMLDVARRFNVTRIKKCCQIMGRLEGSLTSAQVLYPLMQCTDVFFLKADICQLGVDQRKVNMLAREYCDAAKIKNKPIILSHHMLYGLKAGQEKMSKSDPDSAIFMEDTPEDVERKIMAAYCPNQEVEESGEEVIGSSGDAGKESMHLTIDTLKNPCLDYIQNIILCPPGSSFTVQGKPYDKFEPIRADFLDGKITEEELKRGLIQELNNLLQPVRDHFTNDDNAKGLLEQVRQFKKEGNTKIDETKIRRLNLVALNKIQSNCHAVFAPLPSANPSLEDVLGTLTSIKSNNSCISTVLILPDWTARVCNRCDADVKVIDSFYAIFLAALRAFDSDTMKNIVVMNQSEAILQDPSNYWISVINVGRYFSLDAVMGSNVQDSDGVGIVIGRLMKIADIMGLEPSSIAMGSSEDESIERALTERYFDEKLHGMTKPTFSSTTAPTLALQMIESEAHKTENYEYFVLDDPKVHGKSKMKKAFCEPGNTEFCPPIALAIAFGPADIEINRSAENGGDVVYRNKEEMESDFKSGSLHPGDLKATASTIMVGVLEKISSIIKEDKVLTTASKTLKAFEKKQSKKKK
mmetsp:Transcript_17111/g.32376  ORF Transcript_17111/g.32376 Transcript_17111/m.32376 type:complete len:772 (-) Transcript_17111:80-2395(-)